MKGYRVYNFIQQLKDMGFKRAGVAAQLQINRRTVDGYWIMTADEYEAQQQALKRGSSLDDYRDQILYWLRAYPTLSSAQVCDSLKEHYSKNFRERTISRYVKRLRVEKQTLLRRKRAALPAEKTIDAFDFGFQRSVTREQMLRLSDMTWVEQAYYICFLGPPGVGKTHLALALAVRGLNLGYAVAFETLSDLMSVLKPLKFQVQASDV